MNRIRRGIFLAALLSTALTKPLAAQANPAPASPASATYDDISIPYEEFTLPNGLRVVVNTDRTLPVVAVNIWYHVGSRNEVPGKTGFAHLFEHLMFQGSENYRDEFFKPFEEVGVSDRNGTTHFDYTNYFQTVPTPALDMALWMESDRMGHLLGAIDQGTLDEQRGVVQNEKRQRTGAPYGLVADRIYGGIFSGDHPYAHLPIGSMADLNAASIEDVKSWFKSWYGPNNAVLVLSGDIDLATAKEKVTRFFGDIAPSASVPKRGHMVPKPTESTREIFPDRVPQEGVYRAWPMPGSGHPDNMRLYVLSEILGSSGASRLRDRLVRTDEIATAVNAGVEGMELASLFSISAMAKDGVDVAKLEAAIDEEIKRMIDEGPTQQELDRVRSRVRAGYIKSLPKAATRAQLLNKCATIRGKPDCWQNDLRDLAAMTAQDIQQAAKRWLEAPSHTVEVKKSDVAAASLPEAAEPAGARAPAVVPPPDPRFRAVGKGVDRSTGVPKVSGFPDFKLPPFERAKLSNGIDVTLIERHDAPLVTVLLQTEGGILADLQVGKKYMRSSQTMSMLSRGTEKYDASQFAARAEELGVSIGASAMEDQATYSMTALKERLPESFDLLTEMMFRPRLDPAEIERMQVQMIASLKQMRSNPLYAVGLTMPPIIYGADHPRGQVMTEQKVAEVKREDMLAYLDERMRPDGASLFVAGDVTMAEMLPELEARFGKWKPKGAVPSAKAPKAALPAKPRVFLIDQPGTPQSTIMVAQLVPGSENDEANDAFNMAVGALGNGFISRLNLNLREDKHWSYGAGSASGRDEGQTVWSASSAVQADKTADSMREMLGEISRLADGKAPITAEEVALQQAALYSLPSTMDSNSAVAGAAANLSKRGWPDDYYEQYMARVRAMTPGAASKAFADRINPNALTWIVMGPLTEIEASVRALNLGEVAIIDA